MKQPNTNRVLPRKCTGHRKHPFPTTQETALHVDITRWSIPKSAAEDGEALWVSEWVIVAQLCPTLCDPMDCSTPGSSVCGILQARTLEWVALSFSKYSLGQWTNQVKGLINKLIKCSQYDGHYFQGCKIKLGQRVGVYWFFYPDFIVPHKLIQCGISGTSNNSFASCGM